MTKKLRGSLERPRLYIFKSNKHIYAQIIDDIKAKTLITISSVTPEIRSNTKYSANCETSKKVGKLIAEYCLDKGINKVLFDRGYNVYHGKIKALADSARESGINF
uniref:Large ribosomal subunit protein uL18c n=1 Tax=Kumanoa americana TaxID=1196377 RepID=A0A1C9CGX0_9FLOR|nr:ribosomal protein L18 [Kumanoa americana]AOM67617.1 ribosomal protein L18 [Kumanoa americana]